MGNSLSRMKPAVSSSKIVPTTIPNPVTWSRSLASTWSGSFAPIISKPTWKALGTAPLPKAKSVSLDQLMSGLEDGQRVRISGIVRSVSLTTEAMDIEVASGGNRIHVFRHRTPDDRAAKVFSEREST